MNYTNEQLTKLHDVESDILKEVIRVCVENDIEYFVDWGSLLGVVRHGGFIPWDDDVDISMPRESFEKFLSISPDKLRKGYVLQHFSVDVKTPTYCAKVRKDGTKFVEACNVNIPIHQGVFIDIYPIDYLPDDSKLCDKYRKKAAVLKQLYIAKTITEPSYAKSKLKKAMLTMLRTGLHVALIPVPKVYFYNKLDKHLRQYNEVARERVSCIGTLRGEHQYEEVFPLKTATFEGFNVMVPNDATAVLREEYGDWQKIPPENERIGHTPAIFDL